MLSLSGAGAALSRSLERAAGVVSRFTTAEQYGDPCLPPSPEKKRAYRIWFVCVALLESYAVRRTQNVHVEYSEFAVAIEFSLHAHVLNVATRLCIDLYTLHSLDALGERRGVREGKKALKVSEEDAVLFHHFLKLAHRVLVVNCASRGVEQISGFHAYPVKRIFVTILTPTFFGVAFAVRSVEGLLKLSFINTAFTAAAALSVSIARKFSDESDLWLAHAERGRGDENVSRVFATVAVMSGLAPFVSSLVARLWTRDFAARRVTDPRARGREAASGQPAMLTNTRVADTVGLREDGGSELSASAICFQGPEPRLVVIRQSLAGVSPRVTFDGRVLPSSNEPIVCSLTGETHTLLRVFPPRSPNGDTPVGLAWVTTGYRTKRVSPSSEVARVEDSKRTDRESLSSRQGCVDEKNRQTRYLAEEEFLQVGGAVPLLFTPDAKTALEVNEAVVLVRKKMDGIHANTLMMRLGNCITRSTYNARDADAMTEVVNALSMKNCDAMLRNLASTRTDFKSGEISEAQSRKTKGEEGSCHDEYCSVRRRVSWKSLSSSSEDTDVVEGPCLDARVSDDAGGRTRTIRRRGETRPRKQTPGAR